MKAIVVDDVGLNRMMLKMLLRNEGFEVVGTFGSLAEVRQALPEMESLDCAVVDFELDDGTGAEVAEAVAARFPQALQAAVTAHVEDYPIQTLLKSRHIVVIVDKSSEDGEEIRLGLRAIQEGRAYYSPQVMEWVTRRMATVEATITAADKRILIGLARGIRPDEIRERLGVSEKTYRRRIFEIRSKLSLLDNQDLTNYAREHGYHMAPLNWED